MTTYTPLRMIAEDEDDLQIIATCLQDALIPLSGMNYDSETQDFHLIANRFCWECAPETIEGDIFYKRVSTGIAFQHVTQIKKKNVNLQNKTELINLLTIYDSQNNEIRLIFSGGGEIRLTIGKLSCHMKDIDEPYHTPNKPSHELSSSS